LFELAGWVIDSAKSNLSDNFIQENFNNPFINSTLVISAWENERLVGAVRVLSDKIIRSTIYDLVVDPEYQNNGIGAELIKRCISHFPNSEWLLQTTKETTPYYEKIGFKIYADVVMSIPSIYMGN